MLDERASMVRTSETSPVHLVCFVYLVDLVYLVSFVQPNKLNNGLLTLADFFSTMLSALEAGLEKRGS